jgi:hypothetical protein
MIGIIIAIGLAVGAAFGMGKIGSDLGDALGKSIKWLLVIAGVATVIVVVLFFMTKSKAVAGPIQIQGGGKPGG